MVIELVNLLLVNAIALWKKTREDDPKAKTLTDTQVIELLGSESSAVRTRGEAWLAELAARPDEA